MVDRRFAGRIHDVCVGCRSFGVDGDTGRRAVAFAFGPQHGWQRFTVYFLCADGAVCALCPVAPFGTALPASAVQSLAEAAASSNDLAHSPTTEAWMQQVRLPRIMLHWDGFPCIHKAVAPNAAQHGRVLPVRAEQPDGGIKACLT